MKYLDLTLLDESPEITPKAACPHCGGVTFVGVCLRMDATQPFMAPIEVGDTAEYEEYTEHGISEYHYVYCAVCDGLVWFDQEYFLPDDVIERLSDFLDTAGYPAARLATVRGALRSRAETEFVGNVDAARRRLGLTEPDEGREVSDADKVARHL